MYVSNTISSIPILFISAAGAEYPSFPDIPDDTDVYPAFVTEFDDIVSDVDPVSLTPIVLFAYVL
jgi:hypothetical protein